MTLDDLLRIPYERNARGPETLDCWGMVRYARVYLFGRDWLPEFNTVVSGDVRGMTREVVRNVRAMRFERCDAALPGAIATAWSGKTCPHLGIVVMVDGRPRILDTNEGRGPWLHTLSGFAARYNKIAFYDN